MFDNCCHICFSSLSLLTGRSNVNRVVKAVIVIFRKSYWDPTMKGIFANYTKWGLSSIFIDLTITELTAGSLLLVQINI